MKDSFVLFTELIDTVKYMSEEAAGALFKMILNYEAECDLDDGIKDMIPEAAVAFSFIRRQLERTDQKYQDTVEKRRSAGKSGAEKRWQNIANDSKGMANDSKPIANDSKGMAKIADNVPVPVPDNDNNITPLSPSGKKTDLSSLVKEKEFPQEVEEVVLEWVQYKKEKRQGYKETGFQKFLSQVQNNINEYGADKVVNAFEFSMAQNYQGVVWDKCKDDRGSPQNKFDLTTFLLGQIKEGEDDF